VSAAVTLVPLRIQNKRNEEKCSSNFLSSS
jgi:hypothetical protein